MSGSFTTFLSSNLLTEYYKNFNEILVLCFKTSEQLLCITPCYLYQWDLQEHSLSCHIYQNERDLLGSESSSVRHTKLTNIYHDTEWWKECFRGKYRENENGGKAKWKGVGRTKAVRRRCKVQSSCRARPIADKRVPSLLYSKPACADTCRAQLRCSYQR
jgi:hypothetical protein